MKGQVPDTQKKDRASRLRVLSEKKEDEFKRKFIGRTFPSIIMKGEKGPVGLTHNYLKVQINSRETQPNLKIGSLYPLKLLSIENGCLYGRIASSRKLNGLLLPFH